MKELLKPFVSVLLALFVQFTFAQSTELDGLKSHQQKMETASAKMKAEISKLSSELKSSQTVVKSLQEELKTNQESVENLRNELGLKISSTETTASDKFETMQHVMNNNKLLLILIVLIIALLSILVYTDLKRKMTKHKLMCIQDIESTSASLLTRVNELEAKIKKLSELPKAEAAPKKTKAAKPKSES